MLRELQALHDDPKMLQYAPWGLLPKMGAGRVDKEGQGMTMTNEDKKIVADYMNWPEDEILITSKLKHDWMLLRWHPREDKP